MPLETPAQFTVGDTLHVSPELDAAIKSVEETLGLTRGTAKVRLGQLPTSTGDISQDVPKALPSSPPPVGDVVPKAKSALPDRTPNARVHDLPSGYNPHDPSTFRPSRRLPAPNPPEDWPKLSKTTYLKKRALFLELEQKQLDLEHKGDLVVPHGSLEPSPFKAHVMDYSDSSHTVRCLICQRQGDLRTLLERYDACCTGDWEAARLREIHIKATSAASREKRKATQTLKEQAKKQRSADAANQMVSHLVVAPPKPKATSARGSAGKKRAAPKAAPPSAKRR